MEFISIILSASITVFSLGLFIISLVSYLKYKNKKLLFVSAAFFIFLLKGIVMSSNAFVEEFSMSMILFGVLDLVVLIALFVATLKR